MSPWIKIRNIERTDSKGSTYILAGVQFELSVSYPLQTVKGKLEIGVRSPGEPSGLNVYTFESPPHWDRSRSEWGHLGECWVTRAENEVLNTSMTGPLGRDGKAANQCSYSPRLPPPTSSERQKELEGCWSQMLRSGEESWARQRASGFCSDVWWLRAPGGSGVMGQEPGYRAWRRKPHWWRGRERGTRKLQEEVGPRRTFLFFSSFKMSYN